MQLQDRGVGRGDVVAVCGPSGVDFTAAFFGTLHAGAIPALLSPPHSAGAGDADHTATVLETVKPKLVVVDESCAASAANAAHRTSLHLEALQLKRTSLGRLEPSCSPDVALLQFTSGSATSPRAVAISWKNVESHVGMLAEWLEWDCSATVASWLPLYHDMGLIGLLVTPVCIQSDLWLMQPQQFLAEPVRWLECFGSHGATITAAPTFGYAYLTRRVSASELSALDFSAWRHAVVGAERVDPRTLTSLVELLRPRGFDPAAVRPAYGLAEATLAVTGEAPTVAPKAVMLDWSTMNVGAPVQIRARKPLMQIGEAGSVDWLVSCGTPLRGLAVSIVGEDGRELAEGSLGEIVVRGASVAKSYVDGGEGLTRFEQDRLLTGDAGFLLHGELFVVGRIADSVKVRGKRVYAETLEAAVAATLGIPPGKCVAVASPAAGNDEIAVVVECPSAANPSLDDITRVVRSQAGPSVGIKAYRAPPGSIPRTTSGKPRRRELFWRLMCDGGSNYQRLALSVEYSR